MAFVRKNIFTALFLLMAGVQMGWAQRVTVRMKNAQNYEFNLPDVESITFNEEDPAIGHQYVDLELPSGTLWATCNVGANTPEEYGSYYAWGETQPKTALCRLRLLTMSPQLSGAANGRCQARNSLRNSSIHTSRPLNRRHRTMSGE